MSEYPKTIHVGGIHQIVKNAMEEAFWRGGPTVQEQAQAAITAGVDSPEPMAVDTVADDASVAPEAIAPKKGKKKHT